MNEADIEYLRMKLESQSVYIEGERERSKKREDAAVYEHLSMLYLKLVGCLNEADSLLELMEERKKVE